MKMPTKKQTSEFFRILATATLTGVGYALGGTMGSEFMKGIFINLSSNVIESGATKLKEQFLSNGALNHDIQLALTRAMIKSLENVEKRYNEQFGDLYPEKDREIFKKLFKDLNENAENAFPATLEKAAGQEVIKDYIYGEPEIAANRIWERISHTNIFEDDHHRECFKDYFSKHFFSEMQFWFGEELKTDSKECNRAWRAFQRLLLEGIRADVKALKGDQDLILKKLEDLKKLDEIKEQLDLLKDKIDKRQPDEPFQSGLENAVKRMHEDLKNILTNIDQTTQDTAKDVKIIKDILVSQKPYKKGQELLDAIVKNYTSQIPPYEQRLKDFVTENRADEITRAITYLQDHHILFISGIGGVGKTTLARALIETRPANVPLPFWFDFGKKQDATLGDVLEKLAAYLKAPDILIKIEGEDADQKYIDRFTGELQRREQLWLVFDNLETILKDDRKFHDDGMDLLFTSLRGSSHNAKIIVTSRALPELKNGKELIDAVEKKQMKELEGLSNPNAVYYLEKNGFEDVDKQALEKVAEDVDGHPLALELLVGIANDMGVSNALKEMELYRKEKLNKIIIQRRLFKKLAGDEKELLERISVFRKPEPLDALKIMTIDGKSVDNLRNLIRKSLLKTDKTENFWLHPLIREFSYDDLKDKKTAHRLAFSYYMALKLPETRTKKDDVLTLIEACYHAYKAEEYDEAANIIFDRGLNENLDRWGEARTLIELYSGLLPEDHFGGSILLRNKGTHSVILGNLGLAYIHLDQVEKAIEYSEKALDIAQEIGDRGHEGDWLGNLGSAYYILGQVEKATQYYEKALDIAQEIGDRRGEGTNLGNLGNAYRDLDQVEKAIQYYEKALDIAQEIGDQRIEGNCLGNLGNAYSDLGQVEKAIQYYEKAFDIAQEIGDQRGEGSWLGNLGRAYYSLGQVEKATQYYEKALAIGKEIKDPRIIRFCEVKLGSMMK